MKNLQKKYSNLPGDEIFLQCKVNNNKASVKWYRGSKEISEMDNRIACNKDIVGVCTLTILNSCKTDAGKYSCKIVGREKEKNCFTKTEVVIKGI